MADPITVTIKVIDLLWLALIWVILGYTVARRSDIVRWYRKRQEVRQINQGIERAFTQPMHLTLIRGDGAPHIDQPFDWAEEKID